MTPMHLWSRQTFLGWLFLFVGLALIVLAGAPIVVALRAHTAPPPVTMLFLVFLVIGILVALLGAWLLPESGAPAAVTQIIAVGTPILNRLPGLSRVGDPTPKTPPNEP